MELKNDDTPRIYVASKFSNYENVREFAEDLRELGFCVSYDWTLTKEFDEDGSFNGDSGNEISKEDSVKYAVLDQRGVKTADALVMLADGGAMAGAYIELGMALAYGIPVLVLNPERHTVFFDLEQVAVIDTYEDAIAMLLLEFSKDVVFSNE